MALPEIMAKKSYRRDRQSMKTLLAYFGNMLLININLGKVEAYRQKRLATPSGVTPNANVAPASINREVACLRHVFSKAIKSGKAERNPVQGLRQLKENNIRDRVLAPVEYEALIANCADYLVPIIKTAYYTAMRQGEMLGLTWAMMDLREGFAHLPAELCKNGEARSIPLNQELVAMFRAMPQGLPGVKVFTRHGLPINSIREAFTAACKRAGIKGLRFHDLRHTAINNWRLAGHDYFRIMAASGHKTLHVFKRYNTVSKEELKALVAKYG